MCPILRNVRFFVFLEYCETFCPKAAQRLEGSGTCEDNVSSTHALTFPAVLADRRDFFFETQIQVCMSFLGARQTVSLIPKAVQSR